MIIEFIIITPDFNDYVRVFGYLGIFIFFVTVDQLTLIPEEITLISIGYLSANGVFNPFIAGMISMAAFLTIDSVYFFLIKSGNKWSKKLHNKISHSSFRTLENKFIHNFPRTLLVLCFIPRMRLFAPMIASIIRTPFRKFLMYDSVGLLLLTSVYISLGFFFHKNLYRYLAELETLRHSIFIAAMLILFILIFTMVRRNHRKTHRGLSFNGKK
jgi:membrane protein DedA with SNARE-associated domain